MRARLLPPLVLSISGCAHVHVPGNEPGHIDVRRPPEHLDERQVEEPEDPGERMFVLSYGAFGGGGLAFGDGEGTRGAYGVGPEVSALFGSKDRSHADEFDLIIPPNSVGGNFGWILLSGEGKSLGPLYAEFQARTPVGIAAGWGWDPDDARHGPQATLSLGPLYLRGSHLLDGPSELHVGLVFKGSVSWIWSR